MLYVSTNSYLVAIGIRGDIVVTLSRYGLTSNSLIDCGLNTRKLNAVSTYSKESFACSILLDTNNTC